MKTKRRSKSSRITAWFLAFLMTLVFVPTFSYAEEADGGITVYLTVSSQGSLATAGDGSAMAYKEVNVTDIDGDGHYTFDEALVAAHAAYNSAEGYVVSSSGWVTSLWGVADNPASYSFMKNDKQTDVVTDVEVAEGDLLVASVNRDTAYTDWYAYFDQKEKTVRKGESFTLKLSGFQAMSTNDPAPASGVQVGTWDNGSFTPIEGAAADESGNVTLSFDTPGTYIISANGTVKDTYDAAELWQLMEVERDAAGRTVYGKADWNTGDSWVGYTETDYGDGPYPWDEIQWMELYDEDDEPVYDAETFDAGYLLYSGMVIRDCSTIAPACVVTVIDPVTALDYDGDEMGFVKDDLTSTFGMLTPQEGSTCTLSEDGTKVIFSIIPKNTTIYAGFYLGGDIRYPATWTEENYIAMKDTGVYEFELDASYCGKAWPVAPVKKTDMSATTTAQYYLAIPALKSGWIKEDGEWYYYKEGAKLTEGWAKDSKGWCWMGTDGKITKSKWIKDGGEWYYLKANGYMAANEWTKDSKGWMYMNGSGKITKSRWIKDGGEWYYLKANGYMAANEWAKDSGGWMYMNGSGKITKSKWVKDGGSWYYLKANGYMATGTQKINGKTYHFNSSGKWID